MGELSLAPWSYRRLLRQGPANPVLRQLTLRELRASDVGGPGFEAYAYLRKELRPSGAPCPKLYGDADGTGFAPLGIEACHKAISEALERWCFFQTEGSGDAAGFGFDREPTTLGMAAFPWMTPGPARERAMREAVERWSIAAWWEGRLAARPLEGADRTSTIARVIHPWAPGGREVVLVRDEVEVRGERLSVYGFSCGRDIGQAFRQATAELRRNREALRKLERGVEEASVDSLFERRLLHFSAAEGRSGFDARLRASFSARVAAIHAPPLLVNQEIRGPWSRYARVWRCLFEMPSQAHLADELDYFLF